MGGSPALNAAVIAPYFCVPDVADVAHAGVDDVLTAGVEGASCCVGYQLKACVQAWRNELELL